MLKLFAGIDPRTRVILLISAALLPLIYGTVWRVLYGPFSADLQATVVTAVVVGTLGAIVGFWLGASASAHRQPAPSTGQEPQP